MNALMVIQCNHLHTGMQADYCITAYSVCYNIWQASPYGIIIYGNIVLLNIQCMTSATMCITIMQLYCTARYIERWVSEYIRTKIVKLKKACKV